MAKRQGRGPSEVYVSGALHPEARRLLSPHARVRDYSGDGHMPHAELCREIASAQGLICFLYDKIDRRLLDAGANLRVVANVAVGFNNIDTAYAASRGIWVTNTPGVLTEATADGAMALLLAVARNVVPADRYVRNENFKVWDFNLFLGADLYGKTLGIIGMGAIGQAVARRARGFGMKILYHNRRRVDAATEQALEARPVSLPRLLRQSDMITVHVPLTDATHHLLGAAELAQVKQGAILINTSRGPVVDEKALVRALRRGRLSGAGLDVFEREPAVEPELLKMDQVVLLPHIASATAATRANMAVMAARNVAAVLRGRRPPNPVVAPERSPS